MPPPEGWFFENTNDEQVIVSEAINTRLSIIVSIRLVWK